MNHTLNFYAIVIILLSAFIFISCPTPFPPPANDPDAVPEAPIVVSGNKELYITWGVNSKASMYEVWFSDHVDFASAGQFVGDLSSTSVTINNLLNSHLYYIWYKPKNPGTGWTGQLSLPGSGTPQPQPNIRVLQGTMEIPNNTIYAETLEEVLGYCNDGTVFTISNYGEAALVIKNITLSGEHASQFSIDTGTTSFNIDQGQSTSFSVKFRPISLGPKLAAVTIASNVPATPTYTIGLSALGMPEPGSVWSRHLVGGSTKQGTQNISDYRSITCSSDGNKIFAANDEGVGVGFILISKDSGNTWYQFKGAGSRAWRSIASSSDGNRLAANGDGKVYTSSDGGSTWAEHIIDNKSVFGKIVSSADGLTLAIYENGFTYISSDGGVTWASCSSAAGKIWADMSISSDGTKLTACIYGGYIYTSSDFGETWIERTSAGIRNWSSIASSSDSMRIAAGGVGFLYISDDGGATWVDRAFKENTFSYNIISSSSGLRLTLISYGIYTSFDGGLSWIERISIPRANSVCCSADGNTIVCGASNDGQIHISTDSGTTWTTKSGLFRHSWYSITSSSNGSKLAAVTSTNVDGNGYIYLSNDYGSTWAEVSTVPQHRSWESIASSSDGLKLAVVGALAGC